MPTGLPDAKETTTSTASAAQTGSSLGAGGAGGLLDAACDMLGTLTKTIEDAIALLMMKWTHLRRLSDILTNLGFTIPFPDLSILPNVLTIDQQLYAALQRACPALKLPAYSNQSVEKLRSQVLAAYQMLSNGLSVHPFSQIKGLQEAYSSLLGQVDRLIQSAGLTGGGLMGCISSFCNGTASGNVKAVLDGVSIPNGFAKNYDQLLTSQQRSLVSQVDAAQEELGLLMGSQAVR